MSIRRGTCQDGFEGAIRVLQHQCDIPRLRSLQVSADHHYRCDPQATRQLRRHGSSKFILFMAYKCEDRSRGASPPSTGQALARDADGHRPDVGNIPAQEIHAQAFTRQECRPPYPVAALPCSKREAVAVGRLGRRTTCIGRAATDARADVCLVQSARPSCRGSWSPRNVHDVFGRGDRAPVHSGTRFCGTPSRSRIRPTVWFTMSSIVLGRS